MTTTEDRTNSGIRELTREEWHELFDARARALIDMSGAEFLRRYDAGEFDDIEDTPEHPEIIDLVMIRPFDL